MTTRVGLIGFGAIGRRATDVVTRGDAGDTEIVSVLVRNPGAVTAAPAPVWGSFEEFIAARPDVVVEVAGHAALRAYCEPVLASGADLLTLSAGAFADEDFMARAADAARRAGRRIIVPTGAIAGLDTIGAASLAAMDEVSHTVRKHPRTFTPDQLGGPPPTTEAKLLFDGAARRGVTLFPENVNVAAAVALAGIGFDRTRLRVFADPSVVHNTHEVQVRGDFGELEIVMRNSPTENPKTGQIVGLSIAKALRDLTAPVVIGG